MNKNPLVYLVPIVLVIGTAFGVGIVTGEVTENSDVTVTVEYVPPEIHSIEVSPDAIDYETDVDIDVEIDSPGHGNAVDQVDVKFEWTGDGEEGEGWCLEKSEEDVTINSWEDDGPIGTLETVEFSPCENGWRAGEWTATATVYGDHPDDDDCEDSDTEVVTVDSYFNIDSVDDASASGEPGEELKSEDFKDNGDMPEIKVTSNDDWSLDDPEREVELTNGDGDSFDIDFEYEEDSGAPTWEDSYDLLFSVDPIPWGQADGTYDTTIEHTLGEQ